MNTYDIFRFIDRHADLTVTLAVLALIFAAVGVVSLIHYIVESLL